VIEMQEALYNLVENPMIVHSLFFCYNGEADERFVIINRNQGKLFEIEEAV
jgi:hypothetical protein